MLSRIPFFCSMFCYEDVNVACVLVFGFRVVSPERNSSCSTLKSASAIYLTHTVDKRNWYRKVWTCRIQQKKTVKASSGKKGGMWKPLEDEKLENEKSTFGRKTGKRRVVPRALPIFSRGPPRLKIIFRVLMFTALNFKYVKIEITRQICTSRLCLWYQCRLKNLNLKFFWN